MVSLLERAVEELIGYMQKYERLDEDEARRLVYEEWEMVEEMIESGPVGSPLYRMIADELLYLNLVA